MKEERKSSFINSSHLVNPIADMSSATCLSACVPTTARIGITLSLIQYGFEEAGAAGLDAVEVRVDTLPEHPSLR